MTEPFLSSRIDTYLVQMFSFALIVGIEAARLAPVLFLLYLSHDLFIMISSMLFFLFLFMFATENHHEILDVVER